MFTLCGREDQPCTSFEVIAFRIEFNDRPRETVCGDFGRSPGYQKSRFYEEPIATGTRILQKIKERAIGNSSCSDNTSSLIFLAKAGDFGSKIYKLSCSKLRVAGPSDRDVTLWSDSRPPCSRTFSLTCSLSSIPTSTKSKAHQNLRSVAHSLTHLDSISLRI